MSSGSNLYQSTFRKLAWQTTRWWWEIDVMPGIQKRPWPEGIFFLVWRSGCCSIYCKHTDDDMKWITWTHIVGQVVNLKACSINEDRPRCLPGNPQTCTCTFLFLLIISCLSDSKGICADRHTLGQEGRRRLQNKCLRCCRIPKGYCVCVLCSRTMFVIPSMHLLIVLDDVWKKQ